MSGASVPAVGGDYLVRPDLVLTGDGLRRGWAVAVRDGRFVDLGQETAVGERHPRLPVVTAQGHLMMPGMVDTHHHLTQAFGTAYAFGEPSEIFRRVWVPLERSLTAEEVRGSARLAVLESLRGGFTTVVDAGTRSPHGPLPIAEAAEELGVRCVLAVACEDGESALAPGEAVDRVQAHWEALADRELVTPSVAVPTPESVGRSTLRAVAAWCAERGATLQIHVNEHLAGVERSLLRHGRRPLEYLHDNGAVGPWLLAAHATLLTPDEAMLLRAGGAAVSYNPVATHWKGNATTPALWLSSLGVRFGLGTDGTRSDGFRLLDAAESAQRMHSAIGVGDPFAGGGGTWLRAATGGGADAVGLGGVTGRIAPGHAADFLLVDLDVPEFVSTRDPVWELVRRGNRDQISQVVVGGALRLVDGWPPGWDRAAYLSRQREQAGDALVRAGLEHAH